MGVSLIIFTACYYRPYMYQYGHIELLDFASWCTICNKIKQFMKFLTKQHFHFFMIHKMVGASIENIRHLPSMTSMLQYGEQSSPDVLTS